MTALPSPPRHYLKIHQSWRKPVRHSKYGIGKIFYQHIRNSIGPVNEVKDFEAGPNIFKIAEGAVAAPVASFGIEQQSAEANVETNIRVDE